MKTIDIKRELNSYTITIDGYIILFMDYAELKPYLIKALNAGTEYLRRQTLLLNNRTIAMYIKAREIEDQTLRSDLLKYISFNI